MSTLADHLASDLNVRIGSCISKLDLVDGRWPLIDTAGKERGFLDWVILNCPPQQSLRILDGHAALTGQIPHVTMDRCWTMMLTTDDLTDIGFDGGDSAPQGNG